MKLQRSTLKSKMTTNVVTYNQEKNENIAFVLRVACHLALSLVHSSSFASIL